ncbi:hypothetical protein BRADI_4g11110v3 [Brachypodium distachyon]|uniref:Late embryogenesis abundant protein LEA-2 subgroup domain-containing protein n=1 Tax=Brachypodium distachyon TaxID=15368 RepID=I1IJN3_BRADI|nr:hypothetical protein BRADI_4g11110v3 [Brachypodium distachyon]
MGATERLPLLARSNHRCTGRRAQHIAGALAALTILGTIVYLICSIPPCFEPELSVTITGTDGLDNATDLIRHPTTTATTLTPVFKLAFRITKRDDCSCHSCIGGPHNKLAVSYGGALLADRAGSLVPEICADGPSQELNVTAWAVDVGVPPFLREQLAAELERGEAVFDATMTHDEPPCHSMVCPPSQPVLVCKAKIGEGLCPCTYESRYS